MNTFWVSGFLEFPSPVETRDNQSQNILINEKNNKAKHLLQVYPMHQQESMNNSLGHHWCSDLNWKRNKIKIKERYFILKEKRDNKTKHP